MKTMLLCLLILYTYLLPLPPRQVQITVKISNPKSVDVYITLPVQGTFFAGNVTKQVLKSDHTLSFTATLEKAGPVLVQNEAITVKLFLQPGDQISLELNPEDKEKPFIISGTHQEGQYLLNNRTGFYEYEARKYIANDSLISPAVTRLKTEMAEEYQAFHQLYAQRQINKPFLEFALLNTTYQYAALQASMGVAKYYPTTFSAEHPRYTATFLQENAAIWENTYQAYSLTNEKALATFLYFDYTYDYASFFADGYQAKKTGTYQKPAGTDYLQKRYHTIEKMHTNEKVKEYLLARFIYMEASSKKYKPELPDIFSQFTRLYPKSIYSPYISPLVEEIRDFHTNKNQQLSPDQHIIDGYHQIHSFTQLTELFRGKTVYVDLWATWCSPCIKEFAHNKNLKRFLEKKDVELLYISMDDDEADHKWKAMIRHHKLSGHHIRTSKKLRNELMDLLWGRKGYTIPHYLIIDKTGEIVEKNAYRPSAKEKLYEQIGKYL
jgi:thiol-disulfide isomerase/thioredoxin